MRPIGAHTSAAGGHTLAIDRLVAIGGTALQVFSGSPRAWARPNLADIDEQKIVSKIKENNISHVFTHALYLVNIASDKQENRTKSEVALQFDLQFDAHVGGNGVVVHLGSHQGRGWEAVRDQVAEGISTILATTPEQSHFLIENSAGQNGKLSSDLAEIRWLLDAVNSPRLGWCFDTCHGWAAGYRLQAEGGDGGRPAVGGSPATNNPSFANPNGWSAPEAITNLNLWDSLKVIHVNDSRDPFASGRDRHACLGEGSIPDSEFSAFFAVPQTKTIPLILEVPGQDGWPDAHNIVVLKRLAGE